VFLSLLALRSSRAPLPPSHAPSAATSFSLLVRAHQPLFSASSRCATAPSRSVASRLLMASRRAPPPLYVPHFRHQSINQSIIWKGFRCESLADECIFVVSGRFVVVVIEWVCEIRSNTRYDDGDVGYAAALRTHLGSLTLAISLVCLFFSCLCSATAKSHS